MFTFDTAIGVYNLLLYDYVEQILGIEPVLKLVIQHVTSMDLLCVWIWVRDPPVEVSQIEIMRTDRITALRGDWSTG